MRGAPRRPDPSWDPRGCGASGLREIIARRRCSLYVPCMRLARDRLIFLCLVALDDIMHGCATAPAAPSPQFRAILATLYALGDRHDRKVFDAFWQSSRLAPSH